MAEYARRPGDVKPPANPEADLALRRLAYGITAALSTDRGLLDSFRFAVQAEITLADFAGDRQRINVLLDLYERLVRVGRELRRGAV